MELGACYFQSVLAVRTIEVSSEAAVHHRGSTIAMGVDVGAQEPTLAQKVVRRNGLQMGAGFVMWG